MQTNAANKPVLTDALPQQSRKRRRTLVWGLLLILLGFLAWNGRLLWSVSKPSVLAVVDPPALSPTPLVNLSPYFRYPRLAIEAPLTDDPSTSPMLEQDWAKIAEALKNGVDMAYEGDSFDTA